MNIDEKIKELEEKQAEILKEIEKLKKEKENKFKRWRARQDNEKYFYKDDMGILACKSDNYQYSDSYRYAIGNYYQTKEQTEIIEQNRLTYQQLKDIALRLNKGQEIDWEDVDQQKYYISYGNEANQYLLFKAITIQHISQVYCLDKSFLQVAFEEIGEEKLKQLLEWGI